MGRTLTEKILAGADVMAGEEIRARPDFVLAYELCSYADAFARDLLAEFGGASPAVTKSRANLPVPPMPEPAFGFEEVERLEGAYLVG